MEIIEYVAYFPIDYLCTCNKIPTSKRLFCELEPENYPNAISSLFPMLVHDSLNVPQTPDLIFSLEHLVFLCCLLKRFSTLSFQCQLSSFRQILAQRPWLATLQSLFNTLPCVIFFVTFIMWKSLLFVGPFIIYLVRAGNVTAIFSNVLLALLNTWHLSNQYSRNLCQVNE